MNYKPKQIMNVRKRFMSQKSHLFLVSIEIDFFPSIGTCFTQETHETQLFP